MEKQTISVGNLRRIIKESSHDFKAKMDAHGATPENFCFDITPLPQQTPQTKVPCPLSSYIFFL